MNFKILLILIWTLLLSLSNCSKKEETTDLNSRDLMAEVKSQVYAFHRADTSLNSDGVLDLLWPEFTMLSDGNHVTYEVVRESSQAFMSSLESFSTEWDSLRLIPLGSNHAISSFIFTDSIVAKDGSISRSRGPNTFVWEKRNGRWKVIYGDADHYSIE